MNERELMEVKDKMGLAQSLIILHRLRDTSPDEDITEAFDVVFEWMDGVSLFLDRFQSEKNGRILDNVVLALGGDLDVHVG